MAAIDQVGSAQQVRRANAQKTAMIPDLIEFAQTLRRRGHSRSDRKGRLVGDERLELPTSSV
jgi:hypothetical protein